MTEKVKEYIASLRGKKIAFVGMGVANAPSALFLARHGLQVYACDRQNFRVIEEVAVGKVFFNWIFGFEGKVRIKAPENVKQQYEDMVRRAAEMIE